MFLFYRSVAVGMEGIMLFQVFVPLLLVVTPSSSGKNNTSASFLESIVAMFYSSALCLLNMGPIFSLPLLEMTV